MSEPPNRNHAPAKAELITPPIRSRIITTLMARQLTTQQIAEMLPDVPLPSLYRHVRVLSDNDILYVSLLSGTEPIGEHLRIDTRFNGVFVFQ